MKNIVVGILTLGIIALMVMIFNAGGAYQGGQQNKVIEDFGDTMSNASTTQGDDRAKEMDKLNALRDKAGNAGAFEVSSAYKSKCASCHGVNGSGEQNGKKLMGPKLFGQTADVIYKDLIDFKAGRKENMIMKGLLIKLSEEDLQAFANEIGAFPAKAEEARNK